MVNLGAILLLAGTILYMYEFIVVGCDRLSSGFVVLHTNRLDLREKTYKRADGKEVLLIPMVHIGGDGFYLQVEKSIPKDASVLMEGVSDKRHLLTEKLDYGPLASELNLASQKEVFLPQQRKKRYADLDVSDFSESTLTTLNEIIHEMNLLVELLENPLDPYLVTQLQAGSFHSVDANGLMRDLLVNRNQHLLDELNKELLQEDVVAVPWGVAHMPYLSDALAKEGFHLSETQEYTWLNFRN